MTYTFLNTVMADDVRHILLEIGRTVRQWRVTKAYDAAKTYQNPTSEIVSLNRDLTALFMRGDNPLVIQYYGVLSPEEVAILVDRDADLQVQDILATAYNTVNEKVYIVQKTTEMAFKDYTTGWLASAKEIPGRRIT